MQHGGRRVAVVGSGIAGLSTAWLLSTQYQVTLYEAEPRLGGHTHTVDVTLDGRTHPVDTGFLVFNDRTYPELNGLFKYLGVTYAESDMSFSVRIDDGDIEWAGTNLNSVFADRRNLLRPAFLSMLREIMRFNRRATKLVRNNTVPACTLGDYLDDGYRPKAPQEVKELPPIENTLSTSTSRRCGFSARAVIALLPSPRLIAA